MMIDWGLVAESLPAYWRGLQVSLLLMLICVSASFLLSVPLAIARVSRNPWLSKPVFLYTYVLRGTPLLVQLYMIYFGLAQFEWLRESIAWPLFRNAWFCAWLAFALNSTAYTTEILAGALRRRRTARWRRRVASGSPRRPSTGASCCRAPSAARCRNMATSSSW